MGGLGRNWDQAPRRHSQGQEEVDPVVEVSRQPDTAEVLHHHGKQVLCGVEGRRGVNRRVRVSCTGHGSCPIQGPWWETLRGCCAEAPGNVEGS